VSEQQSETVFGGYSRYYDLLYADKDYPAEVTYIRGLLSRFGVDGGDVLEFGSGTGRHGRMLAGKGYRVHGVERSAEMVARSSQGGGFTCQEGDICAIRLGRTFSAVLALFHVVSYQVTNQAVSQVFESASAHLASGGLFVFDVWYSPAVHNQGATTRVKRASDAELEVTRIAEPVSFPNENRIDVNYTIFARDRRSTAMDTLRETHAMRHFSIPEIDFIAANSGLKRVACEEFLTASPPGDTTWGVCFVLRKD
jgi:SAM-dependent methyltransferase